MLSFLPSLWWRLRSGGRWPLSKSLSDANSISSLLSLLLWPDLEGPGTSMPSSNRRRKITYGLKGSLKERLTPIC